MWKQNVALRKVPKNLDWQLNGYNLELLKMKDLSILKPLVLSNQMNFIKNQLHTLGCLNQLFAQNKL